MVQTSEVNYWVKGAVWAVGIGLGVVASLSSILYHQLVSYYDAQLVEAHREREIVRGLLDGLIPQISSLAQWKLEQTRICDKTQIKLEKLEETVTALRIESRSKR